ncbi:hypothetical protein Mal48_10200 [Thalassoglobus polymorphus]|uniref:Uncharacterized protein n=1 Tax=Thalassoglobus polymorphus TaxID=2527994 RepID=A0A517QJK6_9PLAN|nr:hypothetical protein Mal48_10200 [Thalassoglobus polymorphus]
MEHQKDDDVLKNSPLGFPKKPTNQPAHPPMIGTCTPPRQLSCPTFSCFYQQLQQLRFAAHSGWLTRPRNPQGKGASDDGQAFTNTVCNS